MGPGDEEPPPIITVLGRYRQEDRAAREDLKQPMMRAEELASMKGVTLRQAQRIIAQSPFRQRIHSAKPGRPAYGIPIDKVIEALEQDEMDREMLGKDEV